MEKKLSLYYLKFYYELTTNINSICFKYHKQIKKKKKKNIQMLKKAMSLLPSQGCNFLFSTKGAIKVALPETKTHLLPSEDFPKETTTDREELLHIFKQMQTIRRIEIACD